MCGDKRGPRRKVAGGVAIGLVTAGLIATLNLGKSFLQSGDELHVEKVLQDRERAVGVMPRSTVPTVEVLAPSCSTPHVVVSGKVRHRTDLVICVFVIRLWNPTRQTLTIVPRVARLRFRGGRNYTELTTLRHVPPFVPPGCSVLVALIFEIQPDEREGSRFEWVVAGGGASSARVTQHIGPIQTTEIRMALPAGGAPAAACPP